MGPRCPCVCLAELVVWEYSNLANNSNILLDVGCGEKHNLLKNSEYTAKDTHFKLTEQLRGK